MLETSARLLRLLSHLQARPDWTGTELAERLDVTTRTIRKDIDRLRRLGYPVSARSGAAGGYRLGAGASLPPLLLDDDEAVAVAVGLRIASAGSVSGIEETAVSALVKLEQILPKRVRRRVNALRSFTVASAQRGPTIAAETLTTIATACRDRTCLRFVYRRADDVSSRRLVEPLRIVHNGWRWYLIAWDTTRDDWRTFRVDRITSEPAPDRRFEPRTPPFTDAAAYIAESLGAIRDRWHARVVLHAPLDAAAPRVPKWAGTVEAIDGSSCMLHASSDWLGALAIHIAEIGVDFTVIEPPELIEHVRVLADRFTRAV